MARGMGQALVGGGPRGDGWAAWCLCRPGRALRNLSLGLREEVTGCWGSSEAPGLRGSPPTSYGAEVTQRWAGCERGPRRTCLRSPVTGPREPGLPVAWWGPLVGTTCRRSHCLSQPCPTPQSPQHGLPPGDVVLNRKTLMKGTQEFKMERQCFCIIEASTFCLSLSIFKNHKNGMLLQRPGKKQVLRGRQDCPRETTRGCERTELSVGVHVSSNPDTSPGQGMGLPHFLDGGTGVLGEGSCRSGVAGLPSWLTESVIQPEEETEGQRVTGRVQCHQPLCRARTQMCLPQTPVLLSSPLLSRKIRNLSPGRKQAEPPDQQL